MLIYLVAGARPNFMKIAPIVRALKASQSGNGLSFKIIHTGQHYDREMNDVFFEELGIPQPEVFMAGGNSDWFFATEPAACEHLRREGKAESSVHYVGHVMVDNVLYQADKLAQADTSGFETSAFKAQQGRYGVVTLHRPSNVDEPATFARIAGALKEIAQDLPLIFPVHPRTRANIEKFGIDLGPNVTLAGPQAYMAFLNLWKDAAVVLTDSGGLQEETTALGVPCITIRENTERPVTVEEGTNVLAGTDPEAIVREARKVLRGEGKQGRRPHLWDGRAAERIVAVLARELAARDATPIAKEAA